MYYTVTVEILQRSSAVQGIDPFSTLGEMTWWHVDQRQFHACGHRGVSEKKLEIFVFLKLETCNLVNTSWCKFTEGDV